MKKNNDNPLTSFNKMELIEKPENSRRLKLISIVAPAYNEEENLIPLYERIKAVMEKIGRDFELIIVENGSIDRSLQILKDIHKKDSRVHYLSLTRNFGHQGALIAGIEYSRGDVVISMDADLQHPPEVIPEMIRLWENGYDLIYTTKRSQKDQLLIRKILNRFFYLLMNRLSGIELHGESDFRLMDRTVVSVFCSLPERNKFLRGLTAWIGFRQIGIEYDVAPRIAGFSKFKFIHLIELAIDGIFAFSITPLRIFTIIGLMISTSSFIYGIYISVLKIYERITSNYNWAPPGWVTLAFVMLFFGGIQLIGIGLLGEYLGRVYDEVKRRPVYIVREGTLKMPVNSQL